MIRSRIHLKVLKNQGQSIRRKSTLQDLTQQSRVKPPGPSPPSTYKSGITRFSRILQWTLIPSEFSCGYYQDRRDLTRLKACSATWPFTPTLANASIYSVR